MQVLSELKHRGVAEVLFVCVDGLSGFPEAIEATFPHATVQTCLVHQVRASLKFVSYKDRKPVAADLRKIYTAANVDHAADELQAFAEKWDGRYPTISQSWLERWEQITPFLAYPPEVRRVIYTTDESVKSARSKFEPRSPVASAVDVDVAVAVDPFSRTAALGRSARAVLRRPRRRADLDSVVCAQRAICVRGSPGGSGGCAPRLHRVLSV